MKEWKKLVAKVFDVRPRISSNSSTIWLEREKASQRFSDAFDRTGGHVCLDGPTGAGKTSLGLSHLVSTQLPYVAVQITSETDWPAFCRQIATPPSNHENSVSTDFEVGVDHGLPTAKFRISLGSKKRKSDDVDLLAKTSSSWSEHDVARLLAERNAVLYVDDVERANDALIKRLADLPRLLTQTFVADNAKVILVGSGDIYQRFYRENPALEERLVQVSLGGFRNPYDSVKLLIRGFNRLDLLHPWNSRISHQRALSERCKQFVWEAADGLPKSINRLGYEIAKEGKDRSGVSARDIMAAAEKMIQEHWKLYAERFPDVVEQLYRDPVSIQVVRCLYLTGIARPHETSSLMQRIQSNDSSITAACIDSAINQLSKLDFLVRTGRSGETIWVKHPTAAHTLGVAMRNPQKFKRIHEMQSGRTSIQLAFALPEVSDHSGDAPSVDA
jgi:hypothetical protein